MMLHYLGQVRYWICPNLQIIYTTNSSDIYEKRKNEVGGIERLHKGSKKRSSIQKRFEEILSCYYRKIKIVYS